MIIAIDGPAASGKGTLAKRLAQYFDYAFLDTGKLYRMVGWLQLQDTRLDAIKATGQLVKMLEQNPDILQDKAIIDQLTTEAVAAKASIVASIQQVRQLLIELQRDFAHHPPKNKQGAVLDGRDIGTVICPDADCKFYIWASPEVRAKRRFDELQNKPLQDASQPVIYDAILADIKMRDERDMNRAHAPLKAADDAVTIDTSRLCPDAVFDLALKEISQKI